MSPTDPAPLPPTARVPRWRRPLLGITLGTFLLASLVPGVRYTGWGLATTRIPFGFPVYRAAFGPLGAAIVYLYVLVPVLLLCALACARRGVERGRALESGILPSLLSFALLMYVAGFVNDLSFSPGPSHIMPFVAVSSGAFEQDSLVTAPTFCLLLLTCFATLRADPPDPARTGLGWTLAAGVLGGWCVYQEADALGSFGALALYIGWSAGWRRATGFLLGGVTVGGIAFAGSLIHPPVVNPHDFDPEKWSLAAVRHLSLPAVGVFGAAFLPIAALGYISRRWLLGDPTPEDAVAVPSPDALPAGPVIPALPAPLPFAPAHRVVRCLLFVALAGVPSALIRIMRFGFAVSVESFIILPLILAVSLCLMRWFERPGRTTHVVLGVVAFAVLLWSALELLHGYQFIADLIREDHLHATTHRLD